MLRKNLRKGKISCCASIEPCQTSESKECPDRIWDGARGNSTSRFLITLPRSDRQRNAPGSPALPRSGPSPEWGSPAQTAQSVSMADQAEVDQDKSGKWSHQFLGSQLPIPSRMVSGFATQEICSRAFRPSRLPISANMSFA